MNNYYSSRIRVESKNEKKIVNRFGKKVNCNKKKLHHKLLKLEAFQNN